MTERERERERAIGRLLWETLYIDKHIWKCHFLFIYDRYRFTEDSMATDIPSMVRALYWPMPSSPGLGGVATPISTMRNSGGQMSARTTVNEPACTLLLYTSLAIP